MIAQLIQLARSMAYPALAAGPAVVSLAILGPFAWWLAATLRGSRVLAVAAAAALAAAAILTLARPGLRSHRADWSRLSICAITDPRTLTAEAILNLVLFVPFASLAVLAIGRPLWVVLLALVTSISIETAQAVYSVGTCDSSDLIRNGLGALVAAILASTVRSVALRAAHSSRDLRASRLRTAKSQSLDREASVLDSLEDRESSTYR